MPKPASAKQKAVRAKFKKAVQTYKEYKRKNPNGTKKLKVFIKEAF